MKITSKVWAGALLAGVLLLGSALGATTARLVDSESRARTATGERQSPRREGYLDWLSAELALSTDQQSQVETIVERHRERMATLWREMRPQFEQTKSDFRAEMTSVLEEDQRARFAELVEQHSKHGRSWKRGQKK
ncbi:MAG: hypothetical protein V3U38_05685 [Gemmatimonadota bacterium]|nr:hypothetical protein [Candidatus Palauibacterales bacterium]